MKASAILLVFLMPVFSHAFTDDGIAGIQNNIKNLPLGEKIAYWAERFAGTPYDPDPLGEYVTKNAIVSDGRVDCMYHTFRSVELAISRTPEEAVSVALEKRFLTKGRLDENGNVLNYDERFQYGEDMIESGRWGQEITRKLGETIEMEGSRGRPKVVILPKEAALNILKTEGLEAPFKSGDIVFFIKYPENRVVGEIVGHIGILKMEADGAYLIHAGGSKNKGGEVKKVLFSDYLEKMPFAGIRVSRLR
jgi:hypothetical protein